VDLNTPSITLAQLNGTRYVTRTVMSISSGAETYTLSWQEPRGVRVQIEPQVFTVSLDQAMSFTVTLTANSTTSQFAFGDILFTGSLGHSGHIPISILSSQVSS
jgi:hypothetical protein